MQSGWVRARILNGQTTSEVVNGNGNNLVGIAVPAAFTGTAITFQIAGDNANFLPVYDDAGTQISIAVAPGRYQALGNSALKAIKGVRFLKLVSGAAEGAQRDVFCVFQGS